MTIPEGPPKTTGLDLDRLEAIIDGTYIPPTKPVFNLSTDTLFGGISGFSLPVDHFELLPGLVLRRTFAHVMASFIMAFAPPARSSAPHPGPWASLQGRGLPIHVEIRLDAKAMPLGFDRLNTLWFVVALLRLRLALPLQMPVLSDRPLQEVPTDVEASNLLPIEFNLSRPLTAPHRDPSEVDLCWVRDHIIRADELMRSPIFNRALRTLDQAVAIESAGAGIVIAWASIETLIRPGTHRITDRITRALAAFFHSPGPSRDREFGKIVRSYEARGGAAHAGAVPEAEQFQAAFRLARRALMQTIEEGQLPDVDRLLQHWVSRS